MFTGNYHSFNAVLDRVYEDLICLREDEHFIEGAEGVSSNLYSCNEKSLLYRWNLVGLCTQFASSK